MGQNQSGMGRNPFGPPGGNQDGKGRDGQDKVRVFCLFPSLSSAGSGAVSA